MLNILRRVMGVREVRQKILFTLTILFLIRILDHITVPLTPEGRQHLLEMFGSASNQQGANQVFGLLNVFSGGSLHTFSIIALSVYPYVTATIVTSLLQPVIPALQNLALQGEAGRRRISQITRILTVPLAFLQAFASCAVYQQQRVLAHFSLLDPRYMLDSLVILLTLTTGVMILVWLGELITEKGIGNGISLIIFGGILTVLPTTIQQGYLAAANGNGSAIVNLGMLLLVSILTIVGMVYMSLGQRRIPVQYPTKRSIGRSTQINATSTTYLPLQINSAGMIPLIFASSFLLFPTILAQSLATSDVPWLKDSALWLGTWVLNPQMWWYWVLNALLVFAFTYFYAFILWQQQNVAETLQKQGAFVQGYRPGEPTRQHLTRILHRVTLGGALFLALATLLPFLLRIGNAQIFSSTSLIIVVGVVLDTIRQVEAEVEIRTYTGFIG